MTEGEEQVTLQGKALDPPFPGLDLLPWRFLEFMPTEEQVRKDSSETRWAYQEVTKTLSSLPLLGHLMPAQHSTERAFCWRCC